MTTNAALQLIGQIIDRFFDTVPDDQVISEVKAYIHNVIDNGRHDGITAHDMTVWQLADALDVSPDNTDPFEIEAVIFAAIDDYDLFND